VTNDIVKRFFAPTLAPGREQFVCRLTVLGLSVVTFVLALTVSGILKMLLIGLSISTAYTLIVLMTMFCPRLCRRSSAAWTLATTMFALALWLVAPASWRILPHPIYWTWMVSLGVFLVAALVDRRAIRNSERSPRQV
jgi:SSS family solute:Na+ symporter